MGIRTCRVAVCRRIIPLLISSAIITLLVYIGLRVQGIFIHHAGVTVTQAQVAFSYNTTHSETRTQYIPRIIHQIFHNWHGPWNDTIPAIWDEARHSCMSLHEGWEYKLWTLKPSRDFIEKEYPWFLETYDGFSFPVQRVDALRYFLMRHYGGIYIDLDNGCRANLEPLLYYPTWLTDGGHGTLSNNILGAQPNHPFWTHVTESLVRYSWKYPLPYLTISYAAGQWFLTDVWERYHAGLSATEPVLTRVMMDMRPGSAPWIFFTHTQGDSWVNWDNALFGWIGTHVITFILSIAACLAAISAVLFCIWRLAKVCMMKRTRYQRLDSSSEIRD